jgi:hypothetical protein
MTGREFRPTPTPATPENEIAMNAIELDIEITADRAIHLKLPSEARTGRARVIVLYETETSMQADSATVRGNLDAFLATLPKNSAGRDHRSIAAQVEAERASWD